MENNYQWYVTYSIKDKSGSVGVGYCVSTSTEEKLKLDDIQDIAKQVKEKEEAQNAFVLDWKSI